MAFSAVKMRREFPPVKEIPFFSPLFRSDNDYVSRLKKLRNVFYTLFSNFSNIHNKKEMLNRKLNELIIIFEDVLRYLILFDKLIREIYGEIKDI